jgi:hypothetical protein
MIAACGRFAGMEKAPFPLQENLKKPVLYGKAVAGMGACFIVA